MLYLRGKKEDGRFTADYSVKEGKDVIRDMVQVILDDFITEGTENIAVLRDYDVEIEDITAPFIRAHRMVYNCPAFKEDALSYQIMGIVEGLSEETTAFRILCDEDNVYLTIVVDEESVDDDSPYPPFSGLVDLIEQKAFFAYGYRQSLIDYKKYIESVDEELAEVLDVVEGDFPVRFGIGNLYQEIEFRTDEDMVPAGILFEFAGEILKSGEITDIETENILISNPLLTNDGDSICFVYTIFDSEEVQKGQIGRPTGVLMGDVFGNTDWAVMEYEERFPDAEQIEGSVFSTALDNAEELDMSGEYYEKAYQILDEIRAGIIQGDAPDPDKNNEYMKLIMANVPESYRPFYCIVSGTDPQNL